MCINRVFLDLDDVLNTFAPHALRSVGCPIGSSDYSSYPIEAGWNISQAAGMLHPTDVFHPSAFWAEMKREVWATIPKSPQFWPLIRLARDAVGPENVFILTTATLSPDCLAGKLEWIREHCPEYFRRQFYMGGPYKRLLAGPGALLVDDNEDNCREFCEHGGSAILFPRPWNILRHVKEGDIEEYLRSCFELETMEEA